MKEKPVTCVLQDTLSDVLMRFMQSTGGTSVNSPPHDYRDLLPPNQIFRNISMRMPCKSSARNADFETGREGDSKEFTRLRRSRRDSLMYSLEVLNAVYQERFGNEPQYLWNLNREPIEEPAKIFVIKQDRGYGEQQGDQ